MPGTYSFYEKRLKGMVSYPVRSSHSCMPVGDRPANCDACREEHEILRKHNEDMQEQDREKRRKK